MKRHVVLLNRLPRARGCPLGHSLREEPEELGGTARPQKDTHENADE